MKEWVKKNKFSIVLLPITVLLFLKIRELEELSHFSYFILILTIILLKNLLPNWAFFRPLKFVLELIVGIVLLIIPIYKSIFVIFLSFLWPLLIIGLLIMHAPEYVFGINFNVSTKVYVFLIAITSFLTFYLKRVLTLFNNLFGANGTSEERQAQLDLTLALANKNRIRFLIYFAFLCYLIFFSINKLSEANLFENSKIDMAVFYSFTTFLALERVSHNLDLMNYKPKNFLLKAIKMWRSLGYFDEIENKEKEDKNK